VKYLLFIWADGLPAPEDLAPIQRDLPRWVEEMDGRGVRLLGRELDLPETAATVRVRDGETLVADGPFAETKEFVAGFNLLECADLDEAIEVAAKCPVSWFQALEIRPFMNGLRLGEEASAFGRGEDGAASPYLLSMWIGVREGESLLSDGPFSETNGFIAGIDVVSCADRQQAIQLAAAHPIARYHAIEVRPFWSE
jgi:hypothetical protein